MGGGLEAATPSDHLEMRTVVNPDAVFVHWENDRSTHSKTEALTTAGPTLNGGPDTAAMTWITAVWGKPVQVWPPVDPNPDAC